MKKINTILLMIFINILINSSHLYSKNSNELYEKIDLFSEVLETIKKEYVDEIKQAEIMDSAINGVLQSLDPYSAYMSPRSFKGMQTETKGEFGGLGIEIGMEAGVVKVIAPIADSAEPNHPGFNINADVAASRIARALNAQKVLFLTDIVGVLNKEGTLLTSLDREEVEAYKKDGTIAGGMIPKVDSCIEAIHDGVNKAHIIDGRVEHSILLELFTSDGVGTQFLRRDNPNNGINLEQLINEEN